MAACERPELEHEATAAGEQTLVSGVRPVTLADRLAARAAAPIAPKRNPNAEQRPCDHGLFDTAARDQLDLFDTLRTGLIDAVRAAECGASTPAKSKE
ncbi:hypothetical protein HFP57_02090 [Parasphingopyxis algicola]|uniref:hypothetical protein n=1 Tax=Parasphingopyxis algicola TaxID=2026624 RepID=UPI0015A264B8|nr:hypothetical protein [Parasphingopyxis algicola]QLC23940.1 hypothetical protein HFP57_02090 [Parasphingopyxis algicola]